MECANQAKPSPAASPPSIAPQGRLGAAAPGLAAALPTPCAGALGALSRWVTLLDCRPIDLPPARRPASACKLNNKTKAAIKAVNHFISNPSKQQNTAHQGC
jgi:hypothetical protein